MMVAYAGQANNKHLIQPVMADGVAALLYSRMHSLLAARARTTAAK
jgi:hypothetical protein